MTHLTEFPYPLARRGSRRDAAHRKRAATQRAVKGTRPSVARGGPPGALRPLPDAPHRAAGRAAIKWGIINAPWYKGRKE